MAKIGRRGWCVFQNSWEVCVEVFIQAAFTALNVEPESDSEEELDDTQEIQVSICNPTAETHLTDSFPDRGSSETVPECS